MPSSPVAAATMPFGSATGIGGPLASPWSGHNSNWAASNEPATPQDVGGEPHPPPSRKAGRNVGGEKMRIGISSTCAVGLAIALTFGTVSVARAQTPDSTRKAATKTTKKKTTKTQRTTSSS